MDNAGTNCAQGKAEIQPQRSRSGFWNRWWCTGSSKVTSDPPEQQKSEEMWWEPPTSSPAHPALRSCCDGLCKAQKNHKISQPSSSGFIQQGSSYNFPVINSWNSLWAVSSRGSHSFGDLCRQSLQREGSSFCSALEFFFRDIILFLRSFKYHLCLVLQKPHKIKKKKSKSILLQLNPHVLNLQEERGWVSSWRQSCFFRTRGYFVPDWCLSRYKNFGGSTWGAAPVTRSIAHYGLNIKAKPSLAPSWQRVAQIPRWCLGDFVQITPVTSC